MKRSAFLSRRTSGVLATLLALSLSAGSPAAPAGAPNAATLGQQIDAYLSPLVASNNYSGVVLVARGDSVVFEKGYGYASIELGVANTPETVFHIASVSKTFTAAAIMKLVERGAINLNAPLDAAVPGYPNGDKLTIHHLLAHTSGIPNINDAPDYDEWALKPQTPESLVAYFKGEPLEFEPGARYSYSNSNYNLLAWIIETKGGLPYGDFLRRELLAPAGLEHTDHPRAATAIVPGLAEGYAPEGTTGLERARWFDWSVKTGNGSLYSNAHDLHRWLRAVHGGKVLAPQSLAATLHEHTPNAGYGWFTTTANSRRIHHINGRAPGWAAQVDYYVDDEVSVIVLSNIYCSITTPIARAIGAMQFGVPYEPMPALDTNPLSQADAERLVGTYRFGADYYVPNSSVMIVNRGGYIYAVYPNGYPASPFIAVTKTTFVVRPFWSSAEFVVGASGKVEELVIDGFRGERLK